MRANLMSRGAPGETVRVGPTWARHEVLVRMQSDSVLGEHGELASPEMVGLSADEPLHCVISPPPESQPKGPYETYGIVIGPNASDTAKRWGSGDHQSPMYVDAIDPFVLANGTRPAPKPCVAHVLGRSQSKVVLRHGGRWRDRSLGQGVLSRRPGDGAATQECLKAWLLLPTCTQDGALRFSFAKASYGRSASLLAQATGCCVGASMLLRARPTLKPPALPGWAKGTGLPCVPPMPFSPNAALPPH